MKPTKTSLHSAIDTLMTYTMFDSELGDQICRLASRISTFLERAGQLVRGNSPLYNILNADIFINIALLCL